MTKGKLKIFFGYSAGVGKTYSMLKAAQELKKSGVDIIIGYLEPHNRPDTIKMAEGLETLPLKHIEYKGIILKEFDVDAALSRHPQLILVDEVAHTNAVGSKNRKRYLDVEELLNNGIDVYTTVNVQHIEGLNDIIDSTTSVEVSERVPDEIFDYADEVALIDIEPAELLERLREGKIYEKSRASVALENFFTENNLSSLRELSLRRSADRIEKQNNNGDLKSKILVLISPSPSSQKNIRVAARMAEAYHQKFTAMYIERQGELSDESADNLKNHMQLVRDMEGELIVKYSEDIIETVADYVRLAGVTNLIIGKTWKSIGKKVGFEDKIIAKMPNIEVLIVPDNEKISVKRNIIKDTISKIFSRRKLMQKYKISNRILDTINLLAQTVLDSPAPKLRDKLISEVLARAFEKSCAIIKNDNYVLTPWQNENLSFYMTSYEMSVAIWCKTNNKSAGKGTDTLRNSQAVYFPLHTNKDIYIVAFSCTETKLTVTDKIIFNQLSNILKILLSN